MSRQNSTPAIEKVPTLDDLLGVTEKAQEDAATLRNMALIKYRLGEIQKDNGLKLTDLVPGSERTFKQELEDLARRYADKWKRIEDAGRRANVEEILARGSMNGA